ncbi:DUF3618 domain-containing protein [Lysobacter sp. GX 14042]|uniref:DUF3618 domain-containing protein n=1 Tax=Lysobacter sp. GX 14042 TaxID=2907155 RepID=UPI001F2EC2E0|nr:DUF3618 domain-containing protein [Lysobacter sp. GX 14042]MCE7032553.1 DUF3618 domain-containing protein [Lysobacter sp. GX 14042]
MNTTDTNRAQSRKEPEQLEREIDRQREHLTGLIDALEGRLSPGEMINKVVQGSRDGGREFAGNLAQAVRDNPTAALLTAAGMAWLWTSQRHPPAPRREPGELRQGPSDTADGARETLDDARERLQEAGHTASEKAHDAADSVRRGAHRASDGFQRMLDDNPMALGAIGIAVGALLGGLLPPTQKEDELLGATRDRVADRTRKAMHEAGDRLAEAGREATTPQQHPDSHDATGSHTNADRYH